MSETRNGRMDFGKWALGACAALMVAGIGGTISVGWSMGQRLSSLEATVGAMAASLSEIKLALIDASRDRYSGTQASLDRAAMMALVDAATIRANVNSERIMRLETRIVELEREIGRTQPKGPTP